MKKFQKSPYSDISKNPGLYSFLKTEFKEMTPFDLSNSEEMIKIIIQMARSIKKNQSNLFRLFGLNDT